MPETRRAYVHVGPPKTGTSYLQSVLWSSTDALGRQGFTVLPAPPGGVSSAELMHAVRGQLRKGLDATSADQVLAHFAEQAAAAATSHVLVTQEQLSGATTEQAERLLAQLPGHEVHLVVTARSPARQVPSSWQERVKTRSQISYDDYLRAVVERSDEATGFWQNQDLPEVLRRWSTSLPPERVHVVTVPPPGGAPDLLLDRYCTVVGLDRASLAQGTTRSNSSLGFVQAELLRRVNVALGDRLPKPRDGYSRVARWYLAARVLQPQGGRPPQLPRSTETWARTTAREWVAQIRARGYDAVGDLGELLPGADAFTDVPPRVDDDALTESAVEALARILTLRVDDNAELDRLKARVAELEGRVAEDTGRRWFARRPR
jgi:hypothetical protein